MIRFFRRKLVACVVLIMLFITLKQKVPAIGNRIGQWIAGCDESYAKEVFSEVYDAFVGGEGVEKVMEVLGDKLQNPHED